MLTMHACMLPLALVFRSSKEYTYDHTHIHTTNRKDKQIAHLPASVQTQVSEPDDV